MPYDAFDISHLRRLRPPRQADADIIYWFTYIDLAYLSPPPMILFRRLLRFD